MSRHSDWPCHVDKCVECAQDRLTDRIASEIVVLFVLVLTWYSINIRMGPTEDALCSMRGGVPVYLDGATLCLSPGIAR